MLEFDFTFFAIAIPAVLFAGVSKGGFGSGASFAATPILALVLPPEMALGILLPLLMLADVTTLGPYWKQWDWRSARNMMLGAVPGVALAVLIYRMTNPDVFRFLIGAVAIAFVLWQSALKYRLITLSVRPVSNTTGYVTGATAGFASFVSHAGGPPVAVYLLAQGMGKTTFQATTVITFWVINCLKFVPYAFLGIFSWDTFKADLFLAPFMVIGALLGVKAHHLLPERYFFGLTYVLLMMTGSKLIWDALT